MTSHNIATMLFQCRLKRRVPCMHRSLVVQLGTEHHEVLGWTDVIFPLSTMHDDFLFEININKSLLQHYDQDSGKTFTVNVKAFNRAGHFTVARSDPFQIHSKQLPSTGIVYHVLNADATEEIGYQEDTSQLCVRWFGFVNGTCRSSCECALLSKFCDDEPKSS